MNQANCPHEAAVSKAARTNEWQESLTTHLAECAHCREIVQASRWMQALAQTTAKTATLPDAQLLWTRAQLADRTAQAVRTRRLWEWVEVLSGATVPLGLAAWVAWNWYVIQGEATKLLVGLAPQLSLAAYSFSSLAPALLILAAISLAYPLLVRE
jgi:hypothetical protein